MLTKEAGEQMSELLASREGRVLRMTLNRPNENNLLNGAALRALAAALEGAQQDGGVGCVLLDAAGSMFCAGLDLEEMAAGSEGAEAAAVRVFGFRTWSKKPLVLAVGGPCLGAGVGLAANAHVVVASQGVQFGLTEIRQGAWPFHTQRAVEEAIGVRRTVEMALTGRLFSSAEALQFGLVHEIAPAFELDDRASGMAMHLASLSPGAVRRGLEFMRAARAAGETGTAELVRAAMREMAGSEDFAEGLSAQKERRRPEWPSLKGQ